MSSLGQHQSSNFVKLLLLGDSKSGKTGSLVSLVKAGYKLRILDLDNLIDSLKFQILNQCPDLIDTVEVRTLRDKRKMTATGPIINGQPKAFIDTIKMLDHWKYKDSLGNEIDLGHPYEWGPDCVLVLDSLSRLCDACFDWRVPLTPIGRSGETDSRATFFDAQGAVEDVLATITGDAFETNVIVISHGIYMDLPDETKKVFPQGVGQKLSPKIPQYFSSYVRYINQGGKRTIQLKSDAMIDLANPQPLKLSAPLPIDTGLATFFEALRGSPAQGTTQPKLKRA